MCDHFFQAKLSYSGFIRCVKTVANVTKDYNITLYYFWKNQTIMWRKTIHRLYYLWVCPSGKRTLKLSKIIWQLTIILSLHQKCVTKKKTLICIYAQLMTQNDCVFYILSSWEILLQTSKLSEQRSHIIKYDLYLCKNLAISATT